VSPRNFLGELEELVLLAVLRLGAGAYGASILRALDEQAGRDVPRGSVYVTLDRLEAKGMVTTREGDPTPGRAGRRRRMVAVTDAGVEALRRTHAVRERLRRGLDEVFQP
jgi:DNA-binding PadR family transcriptional regulator